MGENEDLKDGEEDVGGARWMFSVGEICPMAVGLDSLSEIEGS